VGAPLLVALVAATTWAVVGRALRPVERIRARVAAIGGRDLQARVPEPGTGDEVDRLASTMNEMLARLQGSAERQQRFVADASHELRSPLTGIRAQLEVDLAHPGAADPLATERQVLDEVDRLQRLVADLLVLARHDAGGAAGPGRPPCALDLDDLVLREARRLREGGRVEVDTASVSGAQVVGHADELVRVVRNLVDNAGRHAASRVVLALREDDRWAELTVADDGAGIPADQRDRLFDRFTRADDARARDQGGSGLGLAITRALVTDHGGTVELAPSTTGACFVVRLPVAGRERGAAGQAPEVPSTRRAGKPPRAIGPHRSMRRRIIDLP
jgi:signal transduction histidine kinase